jgi:hypothetical protein
MKKGANRTGRPRKSGDTIEFWRFARAGAIMSAYDEARVSGQKHSVAVLHAVEAIRRLYPTMRISSTLVKRVLAEFRPKDSGTILCFERSTLSEEKVEKLRSLQAQAASWLGDRDQKLPILHSDGPPKVTTTFKIRFADRPKYPRHNRKITKQ